ncbi:hypothetical protein, partial [Staphylococcus aureus]
MCIRDSSPIKNVASQSPFTRACSASPPQWFSPTPQPVSNTCLLYTSPSPRDYAAPRMPSSACTNPILLHS